MNQYNIWNQPEEEVSPDALIARLNGLSSSQNYAQFLNALEPRVSYEYPESYEQKNYAFHLPLELQGGVSSINSRRPSFAAEQSYTHPDQQPQVSMEMLAHNNNLQQNFRSRRPSIQISSYTSEPPQQRYKSSYYQGSNNNITPFQGVPLQPSISNGSVLELDNGLLLQGNVIVSSQHLQLSFGKTKNYFCVSSAQDLYDYLCQQCLTNTYLQRVIINLKKLNNMFSLIKPLVLVLTKSGKYEILSTPINSNIMLQKDDVVIVDGDRGKDLVYILDPSITLDVAILINYLKKRQHSKSISYGGTHQTSSTISNTVQDLVNGQGILDEETQFQIPTKQVLRFATFQEIGNLQFKLVEEIKSLKTSLLKISNQHTLHGNLTILSSEYQFDQKKLTFFYHSNQRLDFRNLIKELFKIYKTRIWLCAVPKPFGPMTIELNNDVGFDSCKNDDFHVRNFRVTLQELMGS